MNNHSLPGIYGLYQNCSRMYPIIAVNALQSNYSSYPNTNSPEIGQHRRFCGAFC